MFVGIENMTEKSPASAAHSEQQSSGYMEGQAASSVQPDSEHMEESRENNIPDGQPDAQPEGQQVAPPVNDHGDERPPLSKAQSMVSCYLQYHQHSSPWKPSHTILLDYNAFIKSCFAP